jgi:hypothetical protein
MNWLIIDTALGLALIGFYLLLDQCGRILTRMKRRRISPEKKVVDREKPPLFGKPIGLPRRRTPGDRPVLLSQSKTARQSVHFRLSPGNRQPLKDSLVDLSRQFQGSRSFWVTLSLWGP